MTYTVHLIRSLKQLGLDVELYEIKSRTEAKKRMFSEEIVYQNLSLEDACKVAEEDVCIVLALSNRYYNEGLEVLKRCKNLVFHDPAEFSQDFAEFIQKQDINVITIRHAVREFLAGQGVKSKTILHPYVPYEIYGKDKDWNAVSIARICWDKNTHMLYEANAILDAEGLANKKCKIYGWDNRAYSLRKLQPLFPDWRKDWLGQFGYGEGVQLAGRSKFAVDLTYIRNDGGGTQYTFLEAWDAGAVLVLNSAWLAYKKDCLKDGQNCLSVEDGVDLARLLSGPTSYQEIALAGKAMLANHAPEIIIPAYFDALE